MSKYQYPKKIREISGMGGSYEEDCRQMVIAGMQWHDNNPNSNPQFSIHPQMYGFLKPENNEAVNITDYMNKAIEGRATGAMMQACINIVTHARKIGWAAYIKHIKTKEEKRKN